MDRETINQETLRWLEEDGANGDPIMMMVKVRRSLDPGDGNRALPSRSSAKHNEVASFSPTSSNDVTRLGKALAKHQRRGSSSLDIDGGDGFDGLLTSNDAFLQGLHLNDSIRTLILRCCSSEEAAIALIRACCGLTVVNLEHCNFGDKGIRTLSQSLMSVGGRADLQRIHLNSIDLSGARLNMLVSGGMNLLEDIHLTNCNITDTRPLASLLKSTNCKLKMLRLYDNPIDNEGAMILAESMTKNVTLTHLYMDSVPDECVLESLSQALCNTSCPSATYYSNHTLSYIIVGSGELPDNIEQMCKLNRRHCGPNKRNVALKKIWKVHPHIDTTPLFEYDMKLLPHMINWVESSYWFEKRKDGHINHTRKINALYEFIRGQPFSVVADTQWRGKPRGSTRKRKRDNTWIGKAMLRLWGQGCVSFTVVVCLLVAILTQTTAPESLSPCRGVELNLKAVSRMHEAKGVESIY